MASLTISDVGFIFFVAIPPYYIPNKYVQGLTDFSVSDGSMMKKKMVQLRDY